MFIASIDSEYTVVYDYIHKYPIINFDGCLFPTGTLSDVTNTSDSFHLHNVVSEDRILSLQSYSCSIYQSNEKFYSPSSLFAYNYIVLREYSRWHWNCSIRHKIPIMPPNWMFLTTENPIIDAFAGIDVNTRHEFCFTYFSTENRCLEDQLCFEMKKVVRYDSFSFFHIFYSQKLSIPRWVPPLFSVM